MAVLPLTKAFQTGIGEFPLGTVVIHDDDIDWVTGALYTQEIEFAAGINRDPVSGTLKLVEISIVPAGMRLKCRFPGMVVLERKEEKKDEGPGS